MEGARLAIIEDLPVVLPILDEVRSEMRPNRGGDVFFVREVGPRAAAGDLESAVGADDSVAVVGTFDDVVFGAAVASVETLDDGRRIGMLHTFVVQPEAREVGIGRAMMDLMIEELQRRGCVGIDSMALPGDRDSKNFFESFGLKARLLTVHLAFDVTT